MDMAFLDEIDKMREIIAKYERLDTISHFKVNSKTYEIIKTVNHPDVVWNENYKVLLIDSKLVWIDDDIADGKVEAYKSQLNSNGFQMPCYGSY